MSVFAPEKSEHKTFFTAPVVGGISALALASGAVNLYIHAENTADLKAMKSAPLLPGCPLVYLDVEDDEEPVGRIVIQLRADVVPRAAENFRVLAAGTLGWGYRSSSFHSIEKGRRIFGGDFVGTGSDGCSIFGDTFADESFALKHNGPGTVGMRSSGPNTNASQFYITTRRLPELDGRSEVVGYVVEGWRVLEVLDKAANTSGGRWPEAHDFRVGACGQLDRATYVRPE